MYIRLMPRSLRAAERAYYGLVSEAAFSNPFGARRDAADARLASARKLSAPASLAELSVEDRALVENAICFDAFHAYMGELDALIEQQERAGDTRCALASPAS